ncbi:MAG: hypothetical protein KC618_04170, partial [Candidatus Omnitrophica bacterium]|nr:hypothetical protein [Candidatus Omnitrophota bacterium]
VTLKIERGLEKVAHELLHSTKVLYHTFKRLKPQLLMAMYSGGIYCHMGEVARQMNICSLNISHGTHVPPNNKYEHIENFRLATSVIINTYKYVAVQTPWTNRFLDYYGDKRPRLFTGPLLYSKITKDDCLKNRKEFVGSNNNIKLILHATTLKRGRRGRLHITETLDEYISGLSDLVRAVNQLSDVFLVIRPHPVCDMTDEQLLALLPASEKIKIFRKGTFSSVLSAVDMLISYSSTCIEEALQNKIPVVLFDKWKRYNHFNIEETQSSLQLKRNPVFYITKPEILSASMDKILKIFDVDPLDEADLALYKYPEDYINNFYNFINEVIETAK